MIFLLTAMNNTARTVLAMIALTCICACTKEKREATYNSQEDKIEKYISSNMYKTTTEDGTSRTDTLRVVYNGGASRLVTTEGLGEELTSEGTVSFYYAGYTFSGSKSYSNMFMTNHEETAKAAKWELEGASYEPVVLNMKDTGLLTGLRDGLIGVRSGENCQILFSGKYGFGQKPFGIIPAESALLFEIWEVRVSNE